MLTNMSVRNYRSANASLVPIQLGCACTVRVPQRYATAAASSSANVHEHSKRDGTCMTGTLLEVRRLWRPPRTTAWRASLRAAHGERKHVSGGRANTTSVVVQETDNHSTATVQRCVMIVDHDASATATVAAAAALHDTDVTASSLQSCATTAGGQSVATSEQRSHASSTAQNAAGERLYGFARIKDRDHRCSGWFPMDAITCADTTCAPSPAVGHPSSAVLAAGGIASGINEPVLSTIYRETTAGMARTQRAKKQLDFLEERLARDCQCPTTIRYFVYLNTYVFAPWYYAPYGLLNAEYDPLSYVVEASATPAPAAAAAAASGVHAPLKVNPYLRDAFLCPFSLRVYSTYDQLRYETQTYRRRHRLGPPGVEIYRDTRNHFSLFELNGSQHLVYCRHLFLLGKSFLENKLAGHDVNNYYFYVFCLHHTHFTSYVNDPQALYFAGYFTWEKQVMESNLACIMTLPCFGHGTHSNSTVPRGIGQFMIAVSYELAYRRRQVGSPERPLSDLGALTYDRYWRRLLLRWMWRKVHEIEGGPVHHTHSHVCNPGSGSGSACTSDPFPLVCASAPMGESDTVHDGEADRESGTTTTTNDDEVRTVGMKTMHTAFDRPPDKRHKVGRSSSFRCVERRIRSGKQQENDADVCVIDDSDECGEHAAVDTKENDRVTQNCPSARQGADGSTTSQKSQPANSGSTTAPRLRRDAGKTPTDVKSSNTNNSNSVTVVVVDSDSQESEVGSSSHGHLRSCAEALTRATTSGVVMSTLSTTPQQEQSQKHTAGVPPGEEQQITIRQIASEVGLEEADVLHTILAMGFLHRNAENRTLRFVIPKHYVEWECLRLEQREQSAHSALFDPALLRRSSGTSHSVDPVASNVS